VLGGSVPLLYLLFDDLSPALAKRFPALSEFFDNVIVVVLPGTAEKIDLKKWRETPKKSFCQVSACKDIFLKFNGSIGSFKFLGVRYSVDCVGFSFVNVHFGHYIVG
jgi:hypothetical protein